MKKIILILITLVFISCDNKKNLKEIITSEYEAIEINGNWEKGKLILTNSVGFYPSGAQKYFVGLFGYSNTDTTYFDDEKFEIKKEGKYEYKIIDGKPIGISEYRGDTTFFYDPDFLDTPSYYYI